MSAGQVHPQLWLKWEAFGRFGGLSKGFFITTHIDQLTNQNGPGLPQVQACSIRFAQKPKHFRRREEAAGGALVGMQGITKNDLAPQFGGD